VKERVGAVLVSPYLPFPKETAAFALRHRLPTMTLMGSLDPVGQLIAYGPNFGEQVRRVASHVDRILKGAKPGDLPVEQPTKFELVINLTTAKALRLTIPQTLPLRRKTEPRSLRASGFGAEPRLHPGITQEVGHKKGQRAPKPFT